MTRARPTRASWTAAAVVSPVVAALAAGSVLWAASNIPLAAATTEQHAPVAAAAPAVATAQVTSTAGAPAATDQPSLAQLRKKAKRLALAVEQARKEAKAARNMGVVSAATGGSTWVPSTPTTSGGAGGGSAAQPAPTPAPEPPPADTWTGSSGG